MVGCFEVRPKTTGNADGPQRKVHHARTPYTVRFIQSGKRVLPRESSAGIRMGPAIPPAPGSAGGPRFSFRAPRHLVGEKSVGRRKRLLTPSLAVSDPPAFCSLAARASFQAGSCPKAPKEAFAAASDWWVRK